jgi:hypothetical protein
MCYIGVKKLGKEKIIEGVNYIGFDKLIDLNEYSETYIDLIVNNYYLVSVYFE